MGKLNRGSVSIMLKSAFVFLVAVLAISALGAEAYRTDNDVIEVKEIITGRISFEKRTTIVPLALCVDRDCRKPEIYWSVVISNSETRFEVDRTFGLGQKQVPETLEIAGTTLRPGDLVELEGDVKPVSRDFALVSDVKRITIVEESHPEMEILPLDYSWMCQSPEEASPQFYVNVRFQREERYESRYLMSIAVAKVADDVSYFPLAEIENVQSELHEDRLTYFGTNGEISARLSIDKGEDRFLDAPSTLIFNRDRSIQGGGTQQMVHSLSCTRTRQ